MQIINKKTIKKSTKNHLFSIFAAYFKYLKNYKKWELRNNF